MKREKPSVRGMNVLLVLGGTAALMCLGLGYGWSVFRGGFHALFPEWSETTLSSIFSVSMISFGAGSFLCGLLLKRLLPSACILLGGAAFCAGFLGVSLLAGASSALVLAGVFLLYGVLSGGGIGMCYNAINSSIPRYFSQTRGRVSGVLMAGYGSGALVLGVVASRLLAQDSVGLFRTFRILAVGIGCVLLLCALAFGNRERYGAQKGRLDKGGEEEGFSPRQVLRLPSFWTLQFRNLFSYAAVLIIIDQAGVLSRTFHMAATAGLIVSIANGLARIPAGFLCDRMGEVKTLRLGNGLLALGAALLWILQKKASAPLFFLCVIAFGMSYGFTPPVSISINETFFGAKYRAVNYSFFSFTLAPASLAGPTVLGLLQDRFGNSVRLSAAIVSAYALLSLLLVLLIQKPEQPWAKEKTGRLVGKDKN